MQKKNTLSIIIVIAFLIIILTACAKLDTETFYTVSGEIIYDLPLKNISVLINGKACDASVIKDDNTFSIASLKKGDVISFWLEGYDFDNITVTQNIMGVIVIPRVKKYRISSSHAEEGGVVEGVGIYQYGNEATIKIKPSAHYTFDGIYENEVLITSEKIYSFKVTSDRNFTIKFNKIIYPVTVIKNYIGGETDCTEKASFGDNVILKAEDNENYIFAKWIFNGTEIFDKHYEFVLNNANPIINCIFLPRLTMPVLEYKNTSVIWKQVKDAASYKIFIDGVFIEMTDRLSVDLVNYDLSSGRYKISVLAYCEGTGDSLVSSIDIDFLRPLDTPSNYGIISENDNLYFSFSKVLGAQTYLIGVNGRYMAYDDLSWYDNGDGIRVDILKLMDAPGTYTFTVIVQAKENAANSAPSKGVSYNYRPALAEPYANINGNILTWSHDNGEVSFDIIIEGVTVKTNLPRGELDLNIYVEIDKAEITVVAKLTNWQNSKIVLEYTKGEK